jgi:predicted permease
MLPVAETIAFIFGLVALGYVAGLTRFLQPATGDALADFAISVPVPLLLFRTIVNADFAHGLPLGLWATYFGAALISWTAGQVMIRRIFGRDARAGVVGGLSAAFSNLVLLGIPFMLGVFGQAAFATLSLVIAVHLPVMMAVSVALYEWAERSDGMTTRPQHVARLATDFIGKLLVNPMIVCILAGFVWRATGWALPGLAVRFVDALANVAAPVALFAMGLGLRKFGISGNVRAATAIAVLKLMAMPAAALALARLVGLDAQTATVAVLGASMPTGINPYLIASRFGTGQALASSAMTIGTAMAALTTGFWLIVVQAVFGVSGP